MNEKSCLINVCENIKMIRAKRGLNQTEVAKQLGITRQAYSQWEKYAEKMTIGKLYKIAQILNCEITDFFVQI